MNGGGLFRPRLVFSAQRKAPPGDRPLDRERAERFRRMVLPHLDAAYTLARYLTRDATAAEDIVQDAFLRAFRSFDGWRGDAPKAWLLAIVRNCFLTSVSIDRGKAVAIADIDALAESDDAPSPETIVADKAEAEMVRRTIEDLPEPFREALVLRELEELSYKEIATITNVPIGTVMSRLARARQMLAQLLIPEPGTVREARP